MSARICGISSMATRAVLAEMAGAYLQRSGIRAEFESIGGVDAVKRVSDGEPFDVVVLAADAIDKLVADGSVVAGSKADLARSAVAIAVREGSVRPDIGSENALRNTVLSARTVGYSTGPSGVALAGLFERWGIADSVRNRIVQAPPGVPVAQLVASGAVELGFQQLSELMHFPGISLLGIMPPGTEIVTTFSAGLCATSRQEGAVRELLAFMRSPAVADAKRRHGMEPV